MARSVLAPLALCLFCLLAAGCGMKHPVTVPMNTPYVVEASAEDIVRMMLYAGFNDEQIMEYGTTVRNGLALYGGTQVHTQDKVKAVFAVVEPNRVYISTMQKGNFVYDMASRQAVR